MSSPHDVRVKIHDELMQLSRLGLKHEDITHEIEEVTVKHFEDNLDILLLSFLFNLTSNCSYR